MSGYRVVLSGRAMERVEAYRRQLARGEAAGAGLSKILNDHPCSPLDAEELLQLLMNTKTPRIFAETAVRGDGSDWTVRELSILGDVAVHVPVTVFDDGLHRNPAVHATPFRAHLLYTPGALLRNDPGGTPADWNEATDGRGNIDEEGFFGLYERRLLPLLMHVDAVSEMRGEAAVITVPGLGCGMFAGPFRGTLGPLLEKFLVGLLKRHGAGLENIPLIYFDPYSECCNADHFIEGVHLLVRPLLQGNGDRPQLCTPDVYGEGFVDTSECRLWSMVAWDHVSWPGNDFYVNSRVTDDAVKAAATDSMYAITGVMGSYDPSSRGYMPPSEYKTWLNVVQANGLTLEVRGNCSVY